jgi:hypothetical protein
MITSEEAGVILNDLVPVDAISVVVATLAEEETVQPAGIPCSKSACVSNVGPCANKVNVDKNKLIITANKPFFIYNIFYFYLFILLF